MHWVDAAVLIPIKAFHQAKQRLHPRLVAADRERLARWTAERVLSAAGELPAYVVCDDDAVAAFATEHGATVLWERHQGLNGAVSNAVATLGSRGHEHVIVVHGDLPRPSGLAELARDATVTLVPDLRLDGTNVLSFPTRPGLAVAYGAGSFRRHLVAATQSGAAVWVVHDQFLALDLDYPSDLDHPLVKDVLPAWLRTNPASRPPTQTTR
jgi:2-phospho-L-lactate/phosphoenolpyruvate guanylyltransferase